MSTRAVKSSIRTALQHTYWSMLPDNNDLLAVSQL